MKICRERDELENQINELFREILELTSRAISITLRADNVSRHPEFAPVHDHDNLLRARLETLKYCLKLRKDCHAC